MQPNAIEIKVNNLYFANTSILLASNATVMRLNNGFLVTMDIRTKPEYDDPLSFSGLTRESKKYLRALDKHLQNL